MAAVKITPKPHYDEESDVLYVSFVDDNEPTFVENIDDILLLEIGWFSGLPKGFRILGPKYHKIKNLKTVIVVKLKKQLQQIMEKKRHLLEEQEPIFTNICDKIPDFISSAR
jgi:hypothetical protein